MMAESLDGDGGHSYSVLYVGGGFEFRLTWWMVVLAPPHPRLSAYEYHEYHASESTPIDHWHPSAS